MLARIDHISDLFLQSLSDDERKTLMGLMDRVIADASARKTDQNTSKKQ
jgi:hypothetical protein